MTLQITNLKTIKQEGNTKLKCCLFGGSGSGKSFLASTLAKNKKVLLIDLEDSAKTLPEDKINIDNIDTLKIKLVKELDEILKMDLSKYEGIIFDSLSELNKMLQEQYAKNPEILSMQEWGRIGRFLERYTRFFKELDKHIIFITLEQMKDNNGQLTKVPLLSGKLPFDLLATTDVVLYMSYKKEKRIAYSEGSETFYAKNRGGKIPRELTGNELDMNFILDKFITLPELATPGMISEIKEEFKNLNLNKNAQLNALLWAKCLDINQLTVPAYQKLSKRIKEKKKLKQ